MGSTLYPSVRLSLARRAETFGPSGFQSGYAPIPPTRRPVPTAQGDSLRSRGFGIESDIQEGTGGRQTIARFGPIWLTLFTPARAQRGLHAKPQAPGRSRDSASPLGGPAFRMRTTSNPESET